MCAEFAKREKAAPLREQVKLTTTCSSCGKPTRPTGPALTGWLFKRCACQDQSQMRAGPQGVGGTRESDGDAAPEAPLPELNEHYRAERLIGEGGMSKVYKAVDKDNRPFAVKLLKPGLAGATNPFEQEIAIASTLTHANIVSVYGHGAAADGSEFAVMDYIDGLSLAAILEDEVFVKEERAVDMFMQVCEGLAYAHSQGVVHLDLKPSNVLISSGQAELAKLTDFGIARVAGNGEPIVETGALVGSLLYVSPERCHGDLVDSRSDIYSLGCTMFEVLSGTAPFRAENPVKTIMKHLQDRPHNFTAPLKKADVSPGLETIVMHCLEKNPNDRYQFAEEILKDLELVKEGREPRVARQQISETKPATNKLNVPMASLLGVLLVAWAVHLSQFDTFNQIGVIIGTVIQIAWMGALVWMSRKLVGYLRSSWDKSCDQKELPGMRRLFLLLSFGILNTLLAGVKFMIEAVATVVQYNNFRNAAFFLNNLFPDWLVQTWFWSFCIACLIWVVHDRVSAILNARKNPGSDSSEPVLAGEEVGS